MKTSMAGLGLACLATLAGCGTKAADCQTFVKVANANAEAMKKADAREPKAFAVVIKALAPVALRTRPIFSREPAR